MSPRAALVLLLVAACGITGPVALAWNEAACTHCHMTLVDRRFGAEVITTKGRALPFDDAGCAATHVATALTADEVSSVWVIDYGHPDSLIPVTTAVFVRSAGLSTPMGSGVVAVADRAAAERLAADAGGTVLDWSELLRLARLGSLGPR